MKFSDCLNGCLSELGLSAKEFGEVSGLSAATVSRYRSGKRVPEEKSEAYRNICRSLIQVAKKRRVKGYTEKTLNERFFACSDFVTLDWAVLRSNFLKLLNTMKLSVSELCRYTNYDNSTISRFKSGERQPSDMEQFAEAIAEFAAQEDAEDKLIAESRLLGVPLENLSDEEVRRGMLRSWLVGEKVRLDGVNTKISEPVSDLLVRLGDYSLNDYFSGEQFEDWNFSDDLAMKISQTHVYVGEEQIKEAELDFLRASILSESRENVIMYNDMSILYVANDLEFGKKWMTGVSLLLKKGVHIDMIHTLDRSFPELLLILKVWIPLYMTGQVTPYFIERDTDVFRHVLRVSGDAALYGDAVVGTPGFCRLTQVKSQTEYFKMKARKLLEFAKPLMEIYRADQMKNFNQSLANGSTEPGTRYILDSVPPLFALHPDRLQEFLEANAVSPDGISRMLHFVQMQRRNLEKILGHSKVHLELSRLTREEFDSTPPLLTGAGTFCGKEIAYTWEFYEEHLKQTSQMARKIKNLSLIRTSKYDFRNIRILVHEGKGAMITKNTAPAIHFIIDNPKLRAAIEEMTSQD